MKTFADLEVGQTFEFTDTTDLPTGEFVKRDTFAYSLPDWVRPASHITDRRYVGSTGIRVVLVPTEERLIEPSFDARSNFI